MVCVFVMDGDAGVDVPFRVAVASGLTVGLVAVATICPAAGASYLGVGMSRAGVMVGVGVGMEGVSL